MTRIANSAATTQLMNLIMRSQRDINTSLVQLTTDKVSQTYSGIAKDSQRLVGLENSTSLIERFSRNNELMDLRLQLTETAIGGIETTLQDFQQSMLDFSNVDMTNEVEVANIQETAYRSLRSLAGHLNTDVNGEFLFAGSRLSTQPVDIGVASLSHLQSKWNGDTITYPTYYENSVYPKLTASTGSPNDPANTGFGRVTFAGGLGGTITSDTSDNQTDTITIAGTVQDGDQYKITVDGTTVTYTVTGAEADLAAVRNNIISAINADPAVSAVVDAAAGSDDGDIILTHDTPGTAFTASVTASNLPPIAQIDTLTITGTPEAGDQYTVSVDGNLVTYTVTGLEGTLAGLRTAITDAINANATVAAIVTASDSAVAGEIYLTATATNTAFTTVVGATDIGPVAQQETVTIGTGTSEAGDVFTTTVAGNVYAYTSVGPENETTIATGLAALIDADPNVGATSAAGVVTITASVAGTPFVSASTVVTDFDSGGDALSATDAVVQANIVGIADNTAAFTTTQGPEAGIQPPIAQVDNLTLTGTYVATDVVSVTIDSLTAVEYTVVANDLTANGDGTGGAASAAQARTNIAAKITAALTNNADTAAVVTATSAGATIELTAINAGTAFSTASTTTDTTVSGNGQSSSVTTPTANFEGGIPAVAQVDNATITGTFEINDTISINVDGIGAVVYTVVANDLTANGDGTGGGVAGNSAAAYNNITTKVAAALNANSATADVVTAAAPGGGGGVVTLTAVTAGTAFTSATLATDVGGSGGGQTSTGTTATSNAAAIITNTDNAATLVSVTATENPFANIPVGASITIANATSAANNGTFTVAANTGSVITVAATQTIVAGSGPETNGALTILSDISYYSGDEISRTHQTSRSREFAVDLTAIDPAFEKAMRAMFIVAQGTFGTDGGLDKNTGRIDDALYLIRSALDPNVGGTPPYGTESDSNIEKIATDIAYDRILIDQTNAINLTLVDFFDQRVIEVENIDQLATITRLLDQQQALEASYQATARIRQLSLVNFI